MQSNRENKIRKPKWLKTDIPKGKKYFTIKKDLRLRNLTTVCEEAKCPNISECWNTDTATFMLLGDTCTRACRFCHIKTGISGYFNPEEGSEIAENCKIMQLKYVVLTMVDRDDLEDGGASHVSKVVKKIKEKNPDINIEILCGDFAGKTQALQTI